MSVRATWVLTVASPMISFAGDLGVGGAAAEEQQDLMLPFGEVTQIRWWATSLGRLGEKPVENESEHSGAELHLVGGRPRDGIDDVAGFVGLGEEPHGAGGRAS